MTLGRQTLSLTVSWASSTSLRGKDQMKGFHAFEWEFLSEYELVESTLSICLVFILVVIRDEALLPTRSLQKRQSKSDVKAR